VFISFNLSLYLKHSNQHKHVIVIYLHQHSAQIELRSKTRPASNKINVHLQKVRPTQEQAKERWHLMTLSWHILFCVYFAILSMLAMMVVCGV